MSIIEHCSNDRCSPSSTITAPYPHYEVSTEAGDAIQAIRNRERYLAQSASTKDGLVAELPA